MKQVVRTYYDNFAFDTQIANDLHEHSNWSVQAMTTYVTSTGTKLLVVYNVENQVLSLPVPEIEEPWDWKKKVPQVGDWPLGPQPTVVDPLPSVLDKSICKGE